MTKPLLKQGVDYSGWALSGQEVVEALMSVPHLPPVLPFRVWQTPQRWEKRCYVATWKMATTDRRQLERWWRLWPEARPGIPLTGSGLVVIDVDDPADSAFLRCWTGPRLDGVRQRYRDREDGWSQERTPSGGYHVIFAMPDPPLVGKIQWSPSVEVIGENFLFVCHNLRELANPRRREREVLPEVFRKRFADAGYGGHHRTYIHDVHRNGVHRGDVHRVNVVGAGDVEVYTAALLAMDPADWIPRPGEEAASYRDWFAFVGGSKAVGIRRETFVEWQCRVPRYANDGEEIARIWDSARGEHGGKFFQAVSARGIKLIFNKPTNTPHTQYISPEVPPQSHNSKPSYSRTISWRDRVASWMSILHGDQIERTLFTAACFIAEISAECGQPTLARGQELLEASCPKLIRQMGIEEVRRTIRRAYDKIASQQKEANDGT